MKKRILSVLLAIVMIVSVLPAQALAAMSATVQNSHAENQAILEELKRLTGNDAEAEEIMRTMTGLGLLSENGDLVSKSVMIDGRSYTLDEVRALLEGKVNLSQPVNVDGFVLTLGELKTMLEIDDELLRIQQTYFGDSIALTEAHQAALASLHEQINTRGIQMTGRTPLAYPSGELHDFRVTVPSVVSVAPGGTATVTVTLNKPAPEGGVSFKYSMIAGNIAPMETTSGTVNITAGQSNANITVRATATSEVMADRWNGDATFLIQYYDISGALFAGDKLAAETVAKVGKTFNWGTFSSSGILTAPIKTQMFEDAQNQSERTDEIIASNNTIMVLDNQHGFSAYIAIPSDLQYWVDDHILTNFDFSGDYSHTMSYSALTLNFNGSYITLSSPFNRLGERAFIDWDGLTGNAPTSLNVSLNFPCSDSKYISLDLAVFDSLTLYDKTAPVAGIATLPNANVYAGTSLPIMIQFSEPVVITSDARLTVNGVSCSPAATGTMKQAVFLYPVQANDDSIVITNLTGNIKDMAGFDLDADISRITKTLNDDFVVGVASKRDAFSGNPSAAVTGNAGNQSVAIEIPLSSVEQNTAWVVSSADAQTRKLNNIHASIDGGITKIDLFVSSDSTAIIGSFTPEMNIGTAPRTGIIEFWLDDKLVPGMVAVYAIDPIVFLEASDITLNYSQAYPTENATIFPYPDPGELRIRYAVTKDNATFKDAAYFSWTSSNETIATIGASDGNIVLAGAAGEVTFTLTYTNGGIDGKAVTVTSRAMTVGKGNVPFLTVPPTSQAVAAKAGQEAVVRWSSNLTDKWNDENGSAAEFTINVYKGTFERPEDSGAPANLGGITPASATLYSNLAAPASQYILHTTNNDISLLGKYSYYVEIIGTNPLTGEEMKAGVYVGVSALPAKVSLSRPASLFLTDETDSLLLDWVVEHYDSNNDASEFKLTVTNNQTGNVQDLSGTTLRKTDAGAIGSGSFSIANVDNSRHRELYTVSAAAKNAEDGTWSYDSFVLYAYDAGALNILLDGQDPGNGYKLSNIDAISNMSQTDILALERNISLSGKLSINANEYSWEDIADQVAWSSSNDNIATVNYREGVSYANISDYSYTSYRPATEFLLAGLSDGTSSITASHVGTGGALSDVLTLEVETLKNKLYLFQFSPAVETTFTYLSGDGSIKTGTSEADGRAAIYDPAGIAVPIYTKSVSNGITYVGTFQPERLVSSEQDAASFSLYPVNNFKLRPVATTELYFKLPDGTPYTGQITLRGGVYKNGVYCPVAQINGMDGKNDQIISLDSNGHATIEMDVSQFYTPSESDQTELKAEDKITYIFEIRGIGNDAYHPQWIEMSANLNASDTVRFGKSIVNLTAVPSGQQFTPYVALQTADFGVGGIIDLNGTRGKVGPSNRHPSITIKTKVIWWGETNDAEIGARSINYFDNFGVRATGQTIKTAVYPFSSMVITENTLLLDSDMKSWLKPMMTNSMVLRYTGADGNLYRSEPQSFKITNMLGVAAPNDPAAKDNLTLLLKSISSNMLSAKPNGANGISGAGDALLGVGFAAIAGGGGIGGDGDSMFQLTLAPTADPTVFRGLIRVAVGGLDMNDVSMAEGTEVDKGQLKDLLTDADKAQEMLNDLDDAFAQIRSGSTNKSKDKDFSFTVGGYMESEIYYENGQWHIHVLNGGFNAGAGMEYTWNLNSWLGPIPVTASFTLGAAAEISFGVGVDRVRNVNHYLTELRLLAYLRAFGGFGFDYSIVALKIGIFGEVSLDMTFSWLNNSGNSSLNMNGQKYTLSGQVGIQFKAKFLFISYSKVLASAPFSISTTTGKYNDIQAAWKTVGKGISANEGIIGAAVNTRFYDSRSGMSLYASESTATLESRDYLTRFDDRSWSAGGISVFMLDPDNGFPSTTWSNAYPYAEPVLTDDGNLMLYLDDMDSADPTATRAAYSVRQFDKYQAGNAINGGSGTGYGDSQLRVAGTYSSAVAAWTRLTADVEVEVGGELTANDQALMMDSTEIMVSVFDGSNWNTTRLTSNTAPDLAPVVATNGTQAVVFWRSVQAADAEAITSFTKDYILYSVCENISKDTPVWSEPATLYNGTSGSVKGIEAAMLADGSCAVVYTADTTGKIDSSGLEVFYAVVSVTNAGDAIANIRLTEDSYVDENPQLTTATISNSEYFVLAWSSQHTANGTTQSDIRMHAFDTDGLLRGDFIDSLSAITQSSASRITSNFRLSKNADDIADLSIIWVEPAQMEQNTENGVLEGDRDILSAVKITHRENGGFGITSPVALAEMPEYTVIDSFDAYTNAPNQMKAVILGTSYDNGYENVGTETEPLWVATPKSTLYTATESFENEISLGNVLFAPGDVDVNRNIPVQFTLLNQGIEDIVSVVIDMNGTKTTFDNSFLLPTGMSTTLTAYYTTGSTLSDTPYTVTATFASGAKNVNGILSLARPDVGVSENFVVRKEADGERTVRVILYNGYAPPLAGSGYTVKLDLFSDSACTLSILNTPVTLNSGDLAAVDAGSYVRDLTLDISAYYEGALVNGEIPEGGLRVYAKAWLEKDGHPVQEHNMVNNIQSTQFESLLERNNGAPTQIHYTLTNDDQNKATVTVDLQNNSLAETQSGNVIVTLLGGDGGNEVLGVQQSYNQNGSLITLGSEGTASSNFTFTGLTKTATTALVTYNNTVLASDNAGLSALSFEGIQTTLTDFIEQDGVYRHTIEVENLHSTTVTVGKTAATAKASLSAKYVDGGAIVSGDDVLSLNVTLTPGRIATITIVVTAEDESTTKTYILTIDNRRPPSIGSSGGGDTPSTKEEEKPEAPALPFGDVAQTAWYYDAVVYVWERGLVLGTGDSSFSPDEQMSRAMLAMLLYRLEGSPILRGTANGRTAKDVPADAWFADAMYWAQETGILQGDGSQLLFPDAPITREQIVTMFYRYVRTQEHTLIESQQERLKPFTDAPNVSVWAQEAMAWAVEHQLIEGKGNGHLDPLGEASRAEVVTILMRLIETFSPESQLP